MKTIASKLFILLIILVLYSCQNSTNTSTPEDRTELFNYLIQKTKEREAFSPIKNKLLHLDIIRNMLQFKNEMIEADTDEKLFDVLLKISNARKDRHLKVSTVKGGLDIPPIPIKSAPVKFAVDYSKKDSFYLFVADYSQTINKYSRNVIVERGDKLVAVNHQSISNYINQIEKYIRYSSINGFWWKLAEALPEQSQIFPLTWNQKEINFEFIKIDSTRYSLTLPYLPTDKIKWSGFYKSHGDQRYPGFKLAFITGTYDLYLNSSNRKMLLLDWYGFKETLIEDMNKLMDYAKKNNFLDYNIIWDGTRSRGGSKGAYALRRLSPKSFKVTFGNVRISDITEKFIERKKKNYAKQNINDNGVKETIDDGGWLMDWLNNDVTIAIKNGDEYSNNVPFKLAHLPKDSDGIITPAPIHFKGSLVCLMSPYGGSHLDQFAAMISDNNLGTIIGMPAGGYSNTWEWEETLIFPISKKPVVNFMWSMGHTIRPNGEILEGNPAKADVYIPQTRENYSEYYKILLSKSFEYLN